MLVGVADNLRNPWHRHQFFWGTLRLTSRNNDPGQRILAVNASNSRPRVLIRGSRDRAGIEDDDFCVRGSGSALQAALFELPFEGSAIRLGRAATKILYVKTCHRNIVAAHPGPSRTGEARTPCGCAAVYCGCPAKAVFHFLRF